jgi:hypothetical protein
LGRARPHHPARPGRQAHDEVPGSRLEILPEAGHFPHLDAPQAFVSTLSDFIESTEAAELNVDNVRERLKAGEAIPQEEGDHGATGIPVD